MEHFPNRLEQRIGPLTSRCGDREDLLFGVEFERDAEICDVFRVLLFRDQVELVERDDLWLLCEHRRVVHQLLTDRGVVLSGGGGVLWIALRIVRECIEDMDDDCCSLNVTQERVT